MPMNKIHDYFLHELGDILDAEQQITKALPQVIQGTTDPALRQRIEQHLRETEQQIRNLEQCFSALGEKPKTEKCTAMAGILQEKQMLDKEKPSKEVLQVGNLGGSMKIEHYEMAAYMGAIGMAKMMGHTEVERLLMENLKQEQDMARFLEQNAPVVLDKLGTQNGDKNMAKQMQGQHERQTTR